MKKDEKYYDYDKYAGMEKLDEHEMKTLKRYLITAAFILSALIYSEVSEYLDKDKNINKNQTISDEINEIEQSVGYGLILKAED